MTVATLITLGRIFLVPVFMTFLLIRIPYADYVAAAIFTIAAATDGLDGYMARSRNEVTRLGILLDPLADKLLISAALVSLVQLKFISAGLAIVVIGREFAVTGLRLVAAAEGIVIPANKWGKLKTVSQIVAIIALLIKVPYALWGMWIAAGITVISGVVYFLSAPPSLVNGTPAIKPSDDGGQRTPNSAPIQG